MFVLGVTVLLRAIALLLIWWRKVQHHLILPPPSAPLTRIIPFSLPGRQWTTSETNRTIWTVLCGV